MIALVHAMPGWGKSRLSRSLAAKFANGRPILFMDPAAVWNYEDVPHYQDYKQTLTALYQGKHAAFTFLDPEDSDRVANGIRAGKDVLAVWDEIRYVASSRKASMSLVLLCRLHRHSRVDLILNTQHVGDANSEIKSAATVYYHGKVTVPSTLEMLERSFGIPQERILALQEGQFIRQEARAMDRLTVVDISDRPLGLAA